MRRIKRGLPVLCTLGSPRLHALSTITPCMLLSPSSRAFGDARETQITRDARLQRQDGRTSRLMSVTAGTIKIALNVRPPSPRAILHFLRWRRRRALPFICEFVTITPRRKEMFLLARCLTATAPSVSKEHNRKITACIRVRLKLCRQVLCRLFTSAARGARTACRQEPDEIAACLSKRLAIISRCQIEPRTI